MLRLTLSALAAACLSGAAAQAATFYTDPAAFAAAAGTQTLVDDYDDLTTSFDPIDGILVRTGYSVQENVGTFFSADGGGANVNGTPFIGLGFSETAASVTFLLGAPISGFSFDVGVTSAAQSYDVEAGAENVQIAFSTTPAFVGVAFDSPVMSFMLTDTDNIGNGMFDNFRVVAAGDTPVPLPAALPLSVLALASLGLFARRLTAEG